MVALKIIIILPPDGYCTPIRLKAPEGLLVAGGLTAIKAEMHLF